VEGGILAATTWAGRFPDSVPTLFREAAMPLCTGRNQTNARRRAAPAPGLPRRLRAMARALRQWWAEERHYRPERHYMRG
jgi:hypothetical protein